MTGLLAAALLSAAVAPLGLSLDDDGVVAMRPARG